MILYLFSLVWQLKDLHTNIFIVITEKIEKVVRIILQKLERNQEATTEK
jgi:hypothetical protein